MKTKIFNIILTLMLTLLGVSEVSAKAAVDMSSGIRDQVYLLEWCSPHSTELSPAGVKPICRTGSFKLVAGVATVVYDGTSYPSGDVTVENRASALVPTTQTSLTTSASNIPLVSLFSNVTNGAFSLEGEGVLTIRVYLMDYADNVSFFQVRYKIDKTGPQLTFKDITENNDTTYYLPDATLSRVNVTQGVNKRDSSITTLTGDSFANPSILSYASSINSTAIARSGNVRDKLHAFYFKNQLATEPFTINTNASDSYFDPVMNTEFLDTSATSNMDGYTTDLVSGMNGFELTDASGLPLAPKSSSTTYTTDKLTSNGQNTQKNYRLRLYDNSVTSTGGLGNYSETAFYAVRDNTPPNIGGNNLATNETGAAERLLSYMDDVTVYDTGAYTSSPVHTPVSDGVSRFIAADNPMSLKYKFDDTGVTGNGSTVGLGCADLSSNLSSSYAGLCNAGIDTTLAAINIEDAANVGTFTQAINFPNRFINAGTDTNTNFSNVKDHMGWSGTNNMYGRYGVAYTSSTNSASNGYDKLCDLVGNCIAPQLSFRVVANVVDNDQSKLTIATLTGMTDDSGTPTGQILANGKNSYKMFYDLKDKYGNSVIPVVSKENANLQIKAVDSKLLFNNGLAINQLGSNPS